MSDNWIVAETYPIEGFWQTQIVLRGAEVVATTAGRTEKQSRERAERIVAAEAALVLAQQNLTKCGLTVISHEATVTQQAATISELRIALQQAEYVLSMAGLDPTAQAMRDALANVPKEPK